MHSSLPNSLGPNRKSQPSRALVACFAALVACVLVLVAAISWVAPTATAARGATAPTITKVSAYFGLASGGTKLTITGTGFKGVTSVTLGGTPVAYTVASSSAINLTTPARAAGLVDIRVTTSAGTSPISAAAKFAYHDPAPSTASLRIFRGTSSFTICTSSNCGPIAVTTSGFANNVVCKVTGGDNGAYGYFWTQGPNTTYTTGIMFERTNLEVTCDGVVGRTTTWPN